MDFLKKSEHRPLRFESLFDCLFVLGLEIFYYDFEKD